jgi:hypothetical protein
MPEKWPTASIDLEVAVPTLQRAAVALENAMLSLAGWAMHLWVEDS